MKFLRNWTNLVTLIGVILVFGIVLSGIDAMYVLIVLGAMNCLYGLYTIITKKPAMKTRLQAEKQSSSGNHLGLGICQLCMGLFVLAMGIIYVNQIVTGKYFWDIILLGLVAALIFWYVLKLRSR